MKQERDICTPTFHQHVLEWEVHIIISHDGLHTLIIFFHDCCFTQNGRTPLHNAATQGYLEVCRCLITDGNADCDEKDVVRYCMNIIMLINKNFMNEIPINLYN